MLRVDSRCVVYRVCKFSSFLCHYLFLYLLFAWLWFYISCLGCLVLYSLFLCRVELGVGGTLFLSLIRVDGVYILFFPFLFFSSSEFLVCSRSVRSILLLCVVLLFFYHVGVPSFLCSLWVVLCLITRSHTKYISTPHPASSVSCLLACFLAGHLICEFVFFGFGAASASVRC